MIGSLSSPLEIINNNGNKRITEFSATTSSGTVQPAISALARAWAERSNNKFGDKLSHYISGNRVNKYAAVFGNRCSTHKNCGKKHGVKALKTNNQL